MLDPVSPDDFICPNKFHRLADVCTWIPYAHMDATPYNDFGKLLKIRTDPIPDSGIIATTVSCAYELIRNLGRGPYIIICHRFGNDDMLYHETIVASAGKVVKWLACQSISWYYYQPLHPLVEVMPIGIHTEHDAIEEIDSFKSVLSEPEPTIVNRVFSCFTIPEQDYRHVPMRQANKQWCQSQPFVTWSEPQDFVNFLRSIRSHQFVFSPWGYGADNYRNWESIYMQRIPIVQRNAFYDQMQDLPFAIYDDISQITENWLDEQYTICHTKSARKASFSYWIDRARTLLKGTQS